MIKPSIQLLFIILFGVLSGCVVVESGSDSGRPHHEVQASEQGDDSSDSVVEFPNPEEVPERPEWRIASFTRQLLAEDREVHLLAGHQNMLPHGIQAGQKFSYAIKGRVEHLSDFPALDELKSLAEQLGVDSDLIVGDVFEEAFRSEVTEYQSGLDIHILSYEESDAESHLSAAVLERPGNSKEAVPAYQEFDKVVKFAEDDEGNCRIKFIEEEGELFITEYGGAGKRCEYSTSEMPFTETFSERIRYRDTGGDVDESLVGTWVYQPTSLVGLDEELWFSNKSEQYLVVREDGIGVQYSLWNGYCFGYVSIPSIEGFQGAHPVLGDHEFTEAGDNAFLLKHQTTLFEQSSRLQASELPEACTSLSIEGVHFQDWKASYDYLGLEVMDVEDVTYEVAHYQIQFELQQGEAYSPFSQLDLWYHPQYGVLKKEEQRIYEESREDIRVSFESESTFDVEAFLEEYRLEDHLNAILDNCLVSFALEGFSSFECMGIESSEAWFDLDMPYINLDSEEISDLSFLADTEIWTLSLENNEVSELTALGEQYELVKLYLAHNLVENLESIIDFTSLEILDLSHNRVSSLEGLSGLWFLEDLRAAHNQISDLSPFESVEMLYRLDLGHNEITDITSLQSLVELEELNLAGNAIESIEALSGLTRLKRLNLSQNPIQDVSPLKNMRELEVLHIEGTLISLEDIVALGLPDLEIVDGSDAEIE